MAFSISTPASSRRARGHMPMAEINIIPLVDVILVLLIIFMITAHVMEFGLEVDVPQVKTVRNSNQEFPVVTITKNGLTQLNETEININNLSTEVRRRFPNSQSVYVRADKSVYWEIVAQIFDELGRGGLKVLAVTQPQEDTPAR